MADEITSTLGLNAEAMFQELARMQRELNSYSGAVNLAATSMNSFNRIGSQTDVQAAKIAKSLGQIEQAAIRTGRELNNLSPAAQNFANQVQSQQNVQKSLAAQLQEAAALARSLGQVTAARELDARAANLQAQATLKTTLQEKANQRAVEARLQQGRDPQNIVTPTQGVVGAEGRAANFFREQQRVITAQDELRTKLRATEESIRKTFRGEPVQKLGQDLEKTGKQGADAGNAIFLSWQSVVRIFTIQVLHRIVAQLSSALIEGAQNAVEFQLAIAEVQTVSRDLNLSFDQLSAKTLEVSNQFGAPLEVVTEGVYNTLSNQVGEAAQAFDLLTTAQRFGIAAVTDTDSAVNLLSSVLNSYNLSVSEAETVSGKLFKTIELGRIRGEEFANTFGRVSVVSAQLGIELDEVLAAIASITVQGLKYNEAFTLITNVEQKLLQPTEELNKLFREMGVTSGEAAIQAFGFQGLLQRLADTTEGSTTEFAKLFNRIRAVRGAFSLTNEQGIRFNKILQDIEKAGAPDLQKAFDTIFNTNAKRFEVELNQIRNLFTTTFGAGIVASVQAVFDAFGGGVAIVKGIGAAITVAATAYLIGSTKIIASTVAMITTFGAAETAVFAFQTALASTRAFLATPAGAALVLGAAVFTAVTAYEKFVPTIEEVTTALKKQVDVQAELELQIERQRRVGVDAVQKDILSSTQQFLFERQQLFQKDAEAAKRLQDTVFGGLQDQVKDRISLISRFADTLNDKFNSARRSAKDLRTELEGIGNNLDAFNFERRVANLQPQQQALAGIARSQETLVALNEALRKGDIDRAEKLQQIASEAARNALSAADETKSIGLVRRAEETVRDTFLAQAKIKQTQIKTNADQIAQAGQLRDTEQARVTRLNELFEQFKKFKAIAENFTVDPKFNPAEAKTQLTVLSEQIKRELEGAAASAKAVAKIDVELNVDDISRQITEKFRDPVTGARIDLTPLIDINLRAIVDRLNKQAGTLTPIELRGLEALGAKPNLTGFNAAQDRILGLQKETDAARKATDDLTLSQAELQKKSLEVVQQTAQLAELLDAVAGRGDLVNKLFPDTQGGLKGFLRSVTDLSDSIPELLSGGIQRDPQSGLSKFLIDQVANFNKALSSGDAVAAQRSLNNVLETANKLRENFPNLATQADTLVKSLQGVLEQAGENQAAAPAAAKLTELETKINSVKGLFETTNSTARDLAPAVQEGVSGASTANDAFNREVQRSIDLLKERNDQASRLQGGGGQGPGRAFGGPVFNLGVLHRAFGGFTRGTDNILTALTRGESVNDVASTRRFFPQIQAMNAGVQPVFRESGGIVNNVGDIHVTVNEAKNGRGTGREVTRALNRELRKKTSNLKGL